MTNRKSHVESGKTRRRQGNRKTTLPVALATIGILLIPVLGIPAASTAQESADTGSGLGSEGIGSLAGDVVGGGSGESGSSGSLGSLTGSGSGGHPGDETGDIEVVDPDAPPLWPDGIPVENEIVPRPDTVVADEGTVVAVNGALGAPQVSIIDPAQADVPEVGKFFVVDVGVGSPTGVLGKVTAVRTLPSGLLQVETSPATIDDAYSQFTINADVSMQDAVDYDLGGDAEPTNSMVGPSAPSMRGGGTGPSTLPTTMDPRFMICDASAPIESDAKVEISDLTTTVVFDPRRKYFKVAPTYTAAFSGEVSQQGGVSCHLNEDRAPTVLIPLGGPLGIRISPEIKYEADAKNTLTADYEVRATTGAEFSGGERRAVLEHRTTKSEFDISALEVSSTLWAGVRLALTGDIKVGEATGGLMAGPQLKLEKNDDGCMEIGSSFKIGAEVKATALWLFEFKASLELVDLYYTKLFTFLCPGHTSTTRTSSSSPTTPTTTTSAPPGFTQGELVGLSVGPQLQCDINSVVDGRSVYFGPGACLTALSVDGVVYGPSVPAGAALESWRPVSHDVLGSGTSSDPTVIRTTVEAGDSGVSLTQTDTFIDGASGYTTSIAIKNTSGEAKHVRLYRAVDCYLDRSDLGTGTRYSSANSCDAVNGRRIVLSDISGGASGETGRYDSIWDIVAAGGSFRNTGMDVYQDNGMGLSWDLAIPASNTATVISRFQLDEPINGAAPMARRAPAASGPDSKEPVGENSQVPTTRG